MNYFRIKFNWISEKEDGSLVPTKTEDIVLTSCYTDAEALAINLLKGKDYYGEVTYEIIKTKISEILYNSAFKNDEHSVQGMVEYYFEEAEDGSEIGLYAVNVLYSVTDEKTGKRKSSKETLFTPATSANGAINFVKMFLTDVETRDWLIRDVKFDKAQSVFVTPQTHKSNLLTFTKYING